MVSRSFSFQLSVGFQYLKWDINKGEIEAKICHNAGQRNPQGGFISKTITQDIFKFKTSWG